MAIFDEETVTAFFHVLGHGEFCDNAQFQVNFGNGLVVHTCVYSVCFVTLPLRSVTLLLCGQVLCSQERCLSSSFGSVISRRKILLPCSVPLQGVWICVLVQMSLVNGYVVENIKFTSLVSCTC